jgi:hypothetical protein
LPAKTITIDLDQREGLYELIRNHLGSIEEFWLAIQREKDFDEAERLGLEFGSYRPRACSRFDWWGPESHSASGPRRASTGFSPRRSASM